MLDMIRDQGGQVSSMRVGKMTVLAMWVFQGIMYVLHPDVSPAPDMTMTATVLAMFGIGAAQKVAEKKKQG